MAESASPGPGRTKCLRRDKPLRTYGRRKQPVFQDEPALKKRKTVSAAISSETKIVESGVESHAVKADEVPTRKISKNFVEDFNGSARAHQKSIVMHGATTTSKESSSMVEKGSILSFFRPISPKNTNSSTSHERQPDAFEQKEQEPEPEPVCKRRINTLRRLRLRKNDIYSCDDSISDKENKSNDQCDKDSNQVNAIHAVQHLQQEKQRKPKPKAQVQTTLDLSTKAAFSECRICDTLWNPLHPDDVKYHNRRHARVLRRAKTRRDGDSSDSVSCV